MDGLSVEILLSAGSSYQLQISRYEITHNIEEDENEITEVTLVIHDTFENVW